MKYLKLFFRLLLGLFMTYAGFSHLTFNRQEFVAQVPTWLGVCGAGAHMAPIQ